MQSQLGVYLNLPQGTLQGVRLVEVACFGVERIREVGRLVGLVATNAVVVDEHFAVSVPLQKVEDEQDHELEVARWTR